MEPIRIRPQPGPQSAFLSSSADIVIYGGAAGGGKSYGLLLEAMRHVDVPQFGAVIFRKTLADVKKQGSLWDTSLSLYGACGGTPMIGSLSWFWGNTGKITFGHLDRDIDTLDWQGAQIPLICFDELTHFSRHQFFYMLSRNRAPDGFKGVKPYIRCTTNPDADSWVAEFIEWWIDQETGYPIPERSGKLRWFARVYEVVEWADTKEELTARFPEIAESDLMPKSVAFIAAKLSDNQILMQKDPGYRANLLALSLIERERLLAGNWKIRAAAGHYFKRHWFKVVPAAPAIVRKRVRSWDLASKQGAGDATAGVLMSQTLEGDFVIEHCTKLREGPFGVETAVLNTASTDGRKVEVRIPDDPGQGAKFQVKTFITKLAGWIVRAEAEGGIGSKEVRAKPFSAQCEAGNVSIVDGPWVNEFLEELETFPLGKHDDYVDAASGAFNHLTMKPTMPMISDDVLRRSRS